MKVNKERVTAWLQRALGKAARFKYALLILLLGVVLLLLPQKTAAQPEAAAAPAETEESLEARLEAVLSQVEGAGRVRVLLTLDAGTAYEYQTDVETRIDSDGSREENRQTVLASAGSGADSAVTVRTTYPTYKGALVVCEGADSAAVRLSIIRAVSSLTGLGSDKITVIKMKQD